jgi:hypothetical protein
MRDAIGWSYDLLSEPHQELFRQLSVFAGGGTPDAAEAVCAGGGVPGQGVRDGLAALVASSLLRLGGQPAPSTAGTGQDPPRVRMLETLREYGSEQLAARGEAGPAGRRHAAYYLALARDAAAELAGPDAAAWLARLDAEHDNLRAALRFACAEPDGLTALRLADALSRYWSERGHLSEGQRWFARALALPVPASADTPSARAGWLVSAARLAVEQAAYDQAAAWCGLALALAGEPDNPAGLAAARNTEGLLARAQDRYADAARAHEAALPLAQAAGQRSEEAIALLGLAYAAMFTGSPRPRRGEPGRRPGRAGPARPGPGAVLPGLGHQQRRAARGQRADRHRVTGAVRGPGRHRRAVRGPVRPRHQRAVRGRLRARGGLLRAQPGPAPRPRRRAAPGPAPRRAGHGPAQLG